MKFTAIDFETANNKRESACSIGIAVVEDFKIVEKFSKLIKPTPNYYEPRNISIHGITQEMTANEPTFEEQWQDLKPYFENHIIVAHNASFDLSVLRYVLSEYELEYPNLKYYCTYLGFKKHHIEYQKLPRLLKYKLPNVCKHLGITDLEHHDAESDAIACANIMIQIFQDHDVSSFEQLESKLEITGGRVFPDDYSAFHINSKRSSHKQHQEIFPETNVFDTGHPFYQKRVTFTGDLDFGLSKDDARQIVANIGGIIKPYNFSSKTNFLVTGSYRGKKIGEEYKTDKYKHAEKLISEGKDIEILTDSEFLEMVHVGETSFEISIEDIEKHSDILLKRNMYNDFSGKNVFFTPDLSIDRLQAFQHVGYCSGYGHDYDDEEVPFTDYFVIAEKHIKSLMKGIKTDSILMFEDARNSAQNRGDLKNVQLISEKTFHDYIDRREKFQRKEIPMNIYEWDVEEEYRITTKVIKHEASN